MSILLPKEYANILRVLVLTKFNDRVENKKVSDCKSHTPIQLFIKDEKIMGLPSWVKNKSETDMKKHIVADTESKYIVLLEDIKHSIPEDYKKQKEFNVLAEKNLARFFSAYQDDKVNSQKCIPYLIYYVKEELLLNKKNAKELFNGLINYAKVAEKAEGIFKEQIARLEVKLKDIEVKNDFLNKELVSQSQAHKEELLKAEKNFTFKSQDQDKEIFKAKKKFSILVSFVTMLTICALAVGVVVNKAYNKLRQEVKNIYGDIQITKPNYIGEGFYPFHLAKYAAKNQKDPDSLLITNEKDKTLFIGPINIADTVEKEFTRIDIPFTSHAVAPLNNLEGDIIIGSQNGNKIFMIRRSENNKLLWEIDLPGFKSPDALAISPQQRYLVVTNWLSTYIYVLKLNGREQPTEKFRIDAGQSASGIAFESENSFWVSYLNVPNRSNKYIITEKGSLGVNSIEIPMKDGVSWSDIKIWNNIDKKTNYAIMAGYGNSKLSIYNCKTRLKVKDIQLGISSPTDMFIFKDYLFIANQNNPFFNVLTLPDIIEPDKEYEIKRFGSSTIGGQIYAIYVAELDHETIRVFLSSQAKGCVIYVDLAYDSLKS